MTKFCGKIGFAITSQTVPGVWESDIVEKDYLGDVVSKGLRYQSSGEINDDIRIESNISIVCDDFLQENLGYMKYVEFMGTKWKIESINPQYPRLLLILGGVYNGPTPRIT